MIQTNFWKAYDSQHSNHPSVIQERETLVLQPILTRLFSQKKQLHNAKVENWNSINEKGFFPNGIRLNGILLDNNLTISYVIRCYDVPTMENWRWIWYADGYKSLWSFFVHRTSLAFDKEICIWWFSSKV